MSVTEQWLRGSKIAVSAMLVLAASSAGAQQIFFDDFESGGISHTENGVKWTSPAGTSVFNGFGKSGSRSLRFTFAAGDDSMAEQRFSLGKIYPELFIEWSVYYPSGLEGNLGPKFVHAGSREGNNNKFLRLWKGDPSDGVNGYGRFSVKLGASTDVGGLVSGDEQIFGEYGTNGGGMGPGGPTGSGVEAGRNRNFLTNEFRGRWLNIKVHAKAATAANNDGVLEIWRDGALLFSVKNLPLYPTGGVGNGFDYGYILGWANSGFAQTSYAYIDDVRISTSSSSVKTPMPPIGVSAE